MLDRDVKQVNMLPKKFATLLDNKVFALFHIITNLKQGVKGARCFSVERCQGRLLLLW